MTPEHELDSPGAAHDAPPRARWLRRVLPLVVLALGAVATVVLVKTSRPPERKKRHKAAHLVEVVIARAERRQVDVVSHGVVQPRREVVIVPEVSGRIRHLHPNLVLGGLIPRGAVMVTIDPADYKLSLEKARSQVAQAERNLAVVQSNARVARQEWKRIGNPKGIQPGPLTLYEPQLKEARALLSAARADLEMSQLNVGRTVLRAPFNLRVRSEQVEVGQYIRVGQDLARVYGTDQVEVVVSLPLAEMQWLTMPQEQGPGTAVAVRLKTGLQTHERTGHLVRAVGEVDPTGRMSKVVVAVDDPFNLKQSSAGYRAAFEIGAFVEVVLQGRELDHVMPIPTEALRRGSIVWVAGPQDLLQIRSVTTAHVDQQVALVLSGLRPGDRVILSNIVGAVEGMKLRVRSAGASLERGAEQARRGVNQEAAHQP